MPSFNCTIIFPMPRCSAVHSHGIAASLISFVIVSLLLDYDSLGIKGRIVLHVSYLGSFMIMIFESKKKCEQNM